MHATASKLHANFPVMQYVSTLLALIVEILLQLTG